MKSRKIKHIFANLKQKYISLAMFVLSICIVGFTGQVSATTRNAASEADFNTAYTSSVAGDIINLSSNIIFTSEKTISKTITINGNSFTIAVPVLGLDDNGLALSGASNYRVFTVSASVTLTINNLNLKGGAISSGYGAVINVSLSGALYLNNCVLSNSSNPNSSGGAIGNSGTVFLNKTRICRNSANSGGGFINLPSSSMFIENCSITDNNTTSWGGGGGENQGLLYINNSTIANNQSSELGGALNNYGATSKTYVLNSSITGNVAYGGTDLKGGGIANNGGTITAINTLFAYNYHISGGTTSSPTSYELDDVVARSLQNQVNLIYCIYHAALPIGTVNLGSIKYNGLQDGSDNTIFTGGLVDKITNSLGVKIGTASIFKPNLYLINGTQAPTLKTGSFLMANKGTQTRFANNANVSPVVAYYNLTTLQWVNTIGTSTTGQLVSTDQVNSTRYHPPFIGAIEIGVPTLSISSSTAKVAKNINSIVTVDVTSNTTWTASSNQSWLSVNSGSTGNGTLMCTITSLNPTISTRSSIVTISAAGLANQTVTVTQAAGDATLSVSASTAGVAKSIGSTSSVTVTSNSSWTAASNQDWLTVTSGATGTGTLTFTIKFTNPEIITRSATVTLKANGAANQIVTVTQSAGDATLSVGASTAAVLKTSGSTASISVISNSTWTATSDQDWLTLTPETTGNGTLTITTTTANPFITTRFATVTIKATGAEYKTVIVTQALGDVAFSVLASTADIDANANNSASINVNCNILWTATSNASWLTIGAITAGSNLLTVSATNTLEASRQAIVTISAQGFPTKTVTVTQAWGANTNKFQLNMTVTAIASINDIEIGNSNFQLAAFIGEECRGVAKLQYVDALKRYLAFMMVWGNKDDMNKMVTFKSLNQTNNIQLAATNTTLAFMPESRSGSPANPYAVNFVQDEASYGAILVTPGGLSKAIKNAGLDINSLTSLKLIGSIDARDFKTMRDSVPLLADLNMSGVTIVGYTGPLGTRSTDSYLYPENEISINAFLGKIKLKTVIMPLSAKSIGDEAFSDCTGLSSITIPSSVTTINYRAFYNCKALTTFITPASLITIGNIAFYNCTALTSFTIPASVTSIGIYAFFGNKCIITVAANNAAYSSIDGVLFDKNQTTLFFCPISKTGTYSMPATVTTIKASAFSGCTAITGLLTISSSVTSIEENAFLGCKGLTSVILPSSVTTLTNWVFSECTGLTSVTLPPTLKTIGAYSFYLCSSLTTFSIPASVTFIKESAFYFCNSLQSIISYSTLPPSLEAKALNFYTAACTLHVPGGSLAAYEAALQWTDFTIQEGLISPTINTDPITVFGATTATINGKITDIGDTKITQHGVVWSTSPNPTIALTTKTTQGELLSIGTFAAEMTGLAQNTLYYIKTYATNGAGISYSPEVSFTSKPIPPSIIVTKDANNITVFDATLNGIINANNGYTYASFEYGLTTAYGYTRDALSYTITGSVDTQVSVGISSLQPNTTYHFRVKGVYNGGVSYGSDLTFTTLQAKPSATTSASTTSIMSTTATINGSVYANNASTEVTFDYGVTTGYGSTLTATPSTVTGVTSTPVSASLTGLIPSTTYYFRVNGVNTAGTTNGAKQSFRTLAPVISITLPTPLISFSSGSGAPSDIQIFKVGASTKNNLVITAPTGYEIRENGVAGNFVSSITFTPVANTVSEKIIEVRISASVALGIISGNVVCTSTGVTSKNVAVTGTVSAPSVSSVSVPTNATYKTGNVLLFTVNFNAPITVTNSPTLALIINSGGTVNANYLSGSGTSAIIFSYTIVANDYDNDGITVGTAINANGGLLKSALDVDAVLALNNVGSTTGLQIDAIAPTVSITSTTSETTNANQIPITITFSKSVTGFVLEDITVANGTTGNFMGSGTSYTATITPAGQGAVTINVASAVAQDAAGNFNTTAAQLTRTFDSQGATVSSVTVPANGTYMNSQTLDFTVNLSEIANVVTAGGTPYIAITLTTGTVNAQYISGSGTSALLFRYTIALGNSDNNGIAVGSSITANGGTIKDILGNNAVLTLNTVGSTLSVRVDAIAPTVSSVNSTKTNGTYKTADLIPITINFSEAATVTGTLTLVLNSGGTAYYASGSGTSALIFNYTVADAQSSADLDYLTTNSLILSAGTITDLAGNTATLTLPMAGGAGSLGANESIVIGILPTVTSQTATLITANTATVASTILNLGYPTPTQYGVVWSTAANPTTALTTKTAQGSIAAAGSFTSTMNGLTASGKYYVRAYATNGAGTNYGNEVILNMPIITKTATLVAFTSCKNTISTEQSFFVSGSYLISDISITAPTGFEICKTSDGTYATSLSLTQTAGTITSNTVYVRLATTATGIPSGNINISSTGATTQTQYVSGTLTTPVPPAYSLMVNPSSGAVCAGSSVTLTATENTNLTFDGIDDYVNLGDIIELNGVSKFTIEAMVYCTTAGQYKTIFSKRYSDTYKIQLYGTNLTFAVGNGNLMSASMATAFPLNTWIHVAAVYNASGSTNAERMKIYINGVSATLTYSGTVPSTTFVSSTPALLGSEATTPSSNICFNGKLNDFRIWNTARTATEILATVNQSVSSASSGLVSEYKLDGVGTSVTAYNSVGNIYNGMLYNFNTANPWNNSANLASYSWSDGISNGVAFTPTKSGIYTVTASSTTGNCPISVSTPVTITVNPLPIPIITGGATVCVNSTENTYSTELGMTGYAWTISSGGTITAGMGTNTIIVKWNTIGTQNISVNYTNGNNCTATEATSLVVNVFPLPIPVVTGNATVCLNSTGTYNTEAGMAGYTWTVSADGTITSGANTNSITVTWASVGAQNVSVNYTNSNNCQASSATTYNVTIVPLPVPTITGAALACINTTENIYSTEAGMTGYVWAITSGGTITSGAGTNTITVKWNVLGNQSISVNYANANNCTASNESTYPVVVNALPTPTITGNAVACMFSTDNIYNTEIGMTGYKWVVSSGGTITAGGGTSDNTCTVTWTTSGAKTVSVNYNNTNGCMAAAAKVYNVTVNPLPASPAFNLKVEPASATVCAGNSVTLTVLKNTDLTFDGANDYVDLGNITELNGASQFTIEAMVYCTASNEFRTIFSKREDHYKKIQLYFPGTNKMTFALGDSDLMEASMSSTFPLNTWVHLVAEYNATASTNQEKMKIYLNGVAATLTYSGTVPSSTATNTATALIGSESTATDTRLYYSGKMNDFRIWNKARSTAQILSSANQCLSDSKSGLIAEYKLDGLVGTSIANNSVGTNYNGNLNNFDLATVWNLSTVGCGNNPSYSWSDGISNGVAFTPTKSGNYTVTATRTNGTCSISESTSVAITVNPLPVPIITGKAAVCINSTGNVYSTESGMSGYSWSVSNGGTITAGGGTNDNTVTITWTSLGNKTVSVNYSNANNCIANTATTYSISVDNPSISASASLVNVNATANNSSTVDISSNTIWTATSSNTSWLTVTAGGTGNGTITFTATDNPNITTRATTVTVKAAGATDVTITVTQDAGNPTLSVSEAIANVAKTANSTAQINVTSNSPWSAASNQNWLEVSEGITGDGILIFTATSANEAITTRSATVTIKATGAMDQTVIVTQAVGDAYLSVSAAKVNIDVTANNTATVNVTSNTEWTATSNENWLTISDGAQGNGKLTFTATNTTESLREAIVTIKGIGVEDQSVIVSQIWGVNPLKFQQSMTVTARAFIDDIEIANSDMQLAVFVDDECRGIGSLVYSDTNKRYMVSLTIWGNAGDENKRIIIKGLNQINSNEMTAINGMLEFIPDSKIGTEADPYNIYFVQKVTNQNIVTDQSLKVYPNPVKNVLHINCQPGDIQELQLTDATGRNLIGYTKMNTNYINTSHLVKGVYFLHIKSNGSMSVHKIVKK